MGAHPVLLEAAEKLLLERGFLVTGKAASTKEALQLLRDQPTDVVVLDLQMSGSNAMTCLREIRARHGNTAVVVLSEGRDDGTVGAALAEGAVACVLKSGKPEDLVTAVRQARRRSIFFPGRGEPAAPVPTDSYQLTARELEILRLVAEGSSNTEVARKLWVTEQTVKFHLSNVYRKLEVSNRTEASRYAQLHGLLGESGWSERAG
ncbi:MAG: response regulator transcription factor [Dehalococcoidia bacterium]